MSSIYCKIKRRIHQFFVKIFPFNYKKYRPFYTIESINRKLESNGSISFLRIYSFDENPGLQLNNNLNKRWSDELKTKLSRNPTIKPQKIIGLKDGRLFTNNLDTIAYINNEGGNVGEVSFQFSGSELSDNGRDNRVFNFKYFDNPAYIDGTLFSMVSGGGSTDNYFHWLYDVIPRYYLLKESGRQNDVDFFIVPGNKKRFQRETLESFGISNDKIIEAKDYTHILAKELIATTHPRRYTHIPKWSVDFLRDSFLKNSLKNGTPKFIYLNRKDASYRKVTNEEEVEQALKRHGFESISLSGYSFKEQVNLFFNADIIVSPHGASLSNLVFCKKGTRILEFFNDNYVYPLYNHLAEKVGLQYQFMIFDSKQSPFPDFLSSKIMRQNIDVNIPKLIKKLEKIMN